MASPLAGSDAIIEPRTRGIPQRVIRALGMVALFFAFSLLLHWRAGTFRSEFGRYQDEGMHYVTGLLMRDFLTSGPWQAPMQFARRFYAHFPKVALGQWPPVFGLLQTGWSLLFGESRVSMLVGMNLVTALLGFAVFRVTAVRVGVLYGVFAGLLLIVAPLTQEQTAMIMAETSLALFSFLSVLAFVRFMNSGRLRDALLSSLWTIIALMTKGNAWVLVAVLPATLFFTKSRRLLVGRGFALYAGLIALICVPYTLATMGITSQGWDSRSLPGIGYLLLSLKIHSEFVVEMLGIPLTLIALLGVADRVLAPAVHGRANPFWLAMGFYAAGIVIFHVVVPTSIEPRKVYQIVPVMCLFAAAGLDALVQLAARRAARATVVRPALAVLAAALVFAVSRFSLLPVYAPGFAPAVQYLLDRPETRGAAVLVSSNPFMQDSEAAIIAEWAARDRTSDTYLIRGTKLLSRPVALGSSIDYQVYAATSDEMRQSLNAVPISYVILHTMTPAARSYPHHELLRAALSRYTDDWERVYGSRRMVLEKEHAIEIYRYRRNIQGVPVRFGIDLTQKLGISIDVTRPAQ